ncbi:MAG: hypothetical protein SF187_23585 [Deltaproteobacteria bacterium]|nr:hypothetical protein [Deltaproteobacteria bacterium]
MKIHIAARRVLLPKASAVAEHLEAAGHRVVSRWLRGPAKRATLAEQAMGDMTDIAVADCLVLIGEKADEETGAQRDCERYVEFGYALKSGKRLCVFGPLETAFGHLEHVQQYRSIRELLDGLR